MSTLNNVESVTHQQGSFKPSIAREGPITDKGHKPGVKVNEADQRPEYHMESFPPGTAPASNSYTSNTNEVGSQADNPNVLRAHGKESTYTSPADTLTGATSQDVHTGLGKPLQGQSGVELAHDGAHGRKKQSSGLGGVGATHEHRGLERQFVNQRGLEREEGANAGTRGNKADRAAEDMETEGAETLDSEWKYEPRTQREKK
ncbi:hypothetical protein N7476_001766 [Penicillium atrosanguineum]|uniref:Uncharacterized protein n=1 Tax=Penicillium atrosanguineum TaxID=1132637 RepID=A0A9W9UDD4_9EURO|nr:hypothetical protein N7476_001766 [Penicillium atrosanguineum]